MNRLFLVCLIYLWLIQIGKVNAQSLPIIDMLGLTCSQYPLSLDFRAKSATLIVEAQAGSTSTTWNTNHRRIYTKQVLHVSRILKGTLTSTGDLSLLLEGGRVGLDQQVLTNTLQRLAEGQRGIFFLVPAPHSFGINSIYTPFGSAQGVITYDLTEGTAADLFSKYVSVADVIDKIASILGSSFKGGHYVASKNIYVEHLKQDNNIQRTDAVTITSFSPTVLAAGIGTVLSIQGSGFGANQGIGYVAFKNADNGGITTDTPRQADYLSWSDTQIRIRVPSLGTNGHPAGTGLLRVVSNSGVTVTSDVPLTVIYALANVENTTSTLIERPNHITANSTGGLSFHLSPNFQGLAVAPWLRALTQWRCSSGINWKLGEVATTNVIANDGQSVIAFDYESDLPAGVVGRTTTYYKGCYNQKGSIVFYTQEIDQQFANPSVVLFQYGPTPATGQQIDFESIAIHELGHAQQLSHIIQPGAVMHYTISRGQNLRVLSQSSDIVAGRKVLRTQSFRNQGCGGQELLPAPLTFLTAEPNGSSISFGTQDECFLNGFVLERSIGTDTTAWQFAASTTAGVVDGKYRLTDSQPPMGLSYYRLGLRRPDGSIDYTVPIASSSVTSDNRIFPNPVPGNQTQLSYLSATDDILTLAVYDELGRLCHKEYATVRIGLNVLPLQTSRLNTGLYLIRLNTQQGISQSIRLVKL